MLFFSLHEELSSPGEASGGGQLKTMEEKLRASLEKCSGWPGWTARMSIGKKKNLRDFSGCKYDN